MLEMSSTDEIKSTLKEDISPFGQLLYDSENAYKPIKVNTHEYN